MKEKALQQEHTEGRSVRERLLYVSPAERASQLSELLRSHVGQVLSVAVDEIPLDTIEWIRIRED